MTPAPAISLMDTRPVEICGVCDLPASDDASICLDCGRPTHAGCLQGLHIWGVLNTDYCRRCAANHQKDLETEARDAMLRSMNHCAKEIQWALDTLKPGGTMLLALMCMRANVAAIRNELR